MAGFSPFGTNSLRGPIGEQLFPRQIRTNEEIAAALAQSHATEQAIAPVVNVDFASVETSAEELAV